MKGRLAHMVAAGTVLGGADPGALARVPLIQPQGEGTFLGSDEQTFLLPALAGGALGARSVSENRALFAHWRPGLQVEPPPQGSPRLVLRVTLPWPRRPHGGNRSTG